MICWASVVSSPGAPAMTLKENSAAAQDLVESGTPAGKSANRNTVRHALMSPLCSRQSGGSRAARGAGLWPSDRPLSATRHRGTGIRSHRTWT